MPSVAAVVGNDALSLVRTTGFCGESLSTPRSSRDGSWDGMVAGAGARNMVFSTFACTAERSGNTIPRTGMGLICILMLNRQYLQTAVT